ncbi:MAG: substrate-binding domain-containing protein [Bacteroidetes bacterium]|nr:substrate-binding domain-containing protein [Bacteroidota bacterium]
MRLFKIILISFFLVTASPGYSAEIKTAETFQKKLAYLVSDQRIPFWDIMWRGVMQRAEKLGYEVASYNAENNAKTELQFTVKAINDNVSGIIVSPTNSSACMTILKLAQRADIPVVISDIGTNGGEYVSYISSDNDGGAYKIGKILVQKLQKLGWQDGKVGIIAIPQKRSNGQARTAGFMRAMNEAEIKGAGIRQQVTFSYQETYDYSKDLIENNQTLHAIWLQGSDRYQGALDAIADAGKKDEILLITFDAEPVFLDLIPKEIIVGAGMQQPFLMGEKAVDTMHQHLMGQPVEKIQKLPVLAITADNIEFELPTIKKNVLGIEDY